ncbi:MAG: MFS transporter, partial [Planctomycetota bacterium]
MEAERKRASFWAQVSSLPANFWYANVIETFERLAFFGVRAIAPLYLVASAGQNGLGLDYRQKGIIYSVWALLQCLVPMVSGGYTERYGYRKSLVVAFTVNILGYIGMAQSKPIADALALHGWENPGFWVFLVAACMIGIGTAIFKPPVHGTIAKTTDEETSSLGWGIFYWVVNIGGALGPMVAAVLRVEIDWDNVFYFAAGVTALNFIPALLLYKEPEKTPPAKDSLDTKGPVGVFCSSILTIFRDLRLVVFLGIFSCFWLMFMQLWDLLPNFIDEWVNTADVAPYFAWFSEGWVLGNGQTKPEMIINIDAISIILLVILISWLIGRISKIAAMIIGMLISLVGFVAAGATPIGWFCCLMVFVFSIGEMACSPTFSAYVGLIAPKDKKALYMGYSNIPFAIGWALGGLIGGFIYDHHGARDALALKHLAGNTELVARAAQAADWSDSLEKIPALLDIDRGEAFDLARSHLGLDGDAAVTTLLEDFKYDRGQITNLALLYVALHEDNRIQATERLGKTLDNQTDDEELGQLGAALVKGNKTIDQIDLAGFVHLLPDAVGKKRTTAFEVARELMNRDLPLKQAREDAEIVDLLWERFVHDQEVLNNLALEYLAQSTNLVRDA